MKAPFRESRNIQGSQTFLDFDERLELISELEIYDLVTKKNI